MVSKPKAATTIQRYTRGYQTRKKIATDKKRANIIKKYGGKVNINKAATTIQKHARGHLTRKKISANKKRVKAATTIQKHARGHLARKKIPTTKAKKIKDRFINLLSKWGNNPNYPTIKFRLDAFTKLFANNPNLDEVIKEGNANKLKKQISKDIGWCHLTNRDNKGRGLLQRFDIKNNDSNNTIQRKIKQKKEFVREYVASLRASIIFAANHHFKAYDKLKNSKNKANLNKRFIDRIEFQSNPCIDAGIMSITEAAIAPPLNWKGTENAYQIHKPNIRINFVHRVLGTAIGSAYHDSFNTKEKANYKKGNKNKRKVMIWGRLKDQIIQIQKPNGNIERTTLRIMRKNGTNLFNDAYGEYGDILDNNNNNEWKGYRLDTTNNGINKFINALKNDIENVLDYLKVNEIKNYNMMSPRYKRDFMWMKFKNKSVMVNGKKIQKLNNTNDAEQHFKKAFNKVEW